MQLAPVNKLQPVEFGSNKRPTMYGLVYVRADQIYALGALPK